jgi:hypothetical protein
LEGLGGDAWRGLGMRFLDILEILYIFGKFAKNQKIWIFFFFERLEIFGKIRENFWIFFGNFEKVDFHSCLTYLLRVAKICHYSFVLFVIATFREAAQCLDVHFETPAKKQK